MGLTNVKLPVRFFGVSTSPKEPREEETCHNIQSYSVHYFEWSLRRPEPRLEQRVNVARIGDSLRDDRQRFSLDGWELDLDHQVPSSLLRYAHSLTCPYSVVDEAGGLLPYEERLMAVQAELFE